METDVQTIEADTKRVYLKFLNYKKAGLDNNGIFIVFLKFLMELHEEVDNDLFVAVKAFIEGSESPSSGNAFNILETDTENLEKRLVNAWSIEDGVVEILRYVRDLFWSVGMQDTVLYHKVDDSYFDELEWLYNEWLSDQGGEWTGDKYL